MTTVLLATLALGSPLAALDPKTAEAHLKFLASEQLAGRMTLSPGDSLAADYVAKQFKKFGLAPLGASYLVPFEVTANGKLGPNNQFLWMRAGQPDLLLKPEEDYVPLQGSQQSSGVRGKLVYYGAGIPAGTDLQGKIVVALRGLPTGPTSAAAIAREVKALGATGLIVVGPQPGSTIELAKLTSAQGIGRNSGIVGINLHQKHFQDLTGLDFAKETQSRSPWKMLDSEVQIRASIQDRRAESQNVIAVLPGTDPVLKNQYIIVGGHHDHLGFGETGSRTGMEQIHFGADDNASGTTGVLMLAEHFARTGGNRRTLLFQTYSGEELGLVGSNAWAGANLPILKSTTLMVNLDMIGRVRSGRVTAYGTESSREMPALIKAIQVAGLTVIADPTVPGNSDHASFSRRNVPVLAFFSGFHTEYHTENDKLDTLNIDGIGQITQAVAQVIREADKLDFKMIARASKAPAAAPSNPRGRRVRTGFVPSMGAEGKGMLLDGVIPGSPAEKAGVKPGDRLLRFGAISINGLDDLQKALEGAKAGEPVKIVVLREGKEVELTITPAAIEG